ncbi:Alpha/Beta hydrolase protein [Diplogelasinospora grovesii]|uniref:Carboxylic ester hydrolase n=1 Tax=Diplogelasinospora grovesii TaxID=303347 RepID=A0AAN6N3Q8_9PEZI|nr:Alpha/Beta hydrolase protein [Diplogelasinospora grovesii]
MKSLLLLLLTTSVLAAVAVDQLTVKTTTGIFTGLVDSDFLHVRQFRSIPYAQPPTGKRRWLPPVAVTPSARRYYSYRFPPSCPQYQSRNLTAWNTNITDFSIRLYGQSYTAGTMAQTSSEDCLSLAIWAPFFPTNTNTTTNPKLPVGLFIPGGDFTAGGVDVPYQQPAPWVERSQQHIMVTANYRVNIAGFPWAAGLDEQNLGIMDIRMALEWVYTNIHSFGGDLERITLWGQSAGGVAVDIVQHAYYDEPLAAGLFMQSGTAMVNKTYPDPDHKNFTFVARNLGCNFSDPVTEVDCMRQVPMNLIQNFVGQYKDNNTKPTLIFKPIPDEKRVFLNYTERALKGYIAKTPALVSTTANEESTLYKYPTTNVTEGPWREGVDNATVSVFVCLTSNTTDARARAGLTTYRYEYAGNFTNITPLWWMGAYHASDIPMIFGTYVTQNKGEITDEQRRVAETMQDYAFAFLTDPQNGLRLKGWMPHAGTVEQGGNMMLFASRGIVAQNASASMVDDACWKGVRYNSNP